MTAEKYDVPYANAVSHGPTLLPPSTKLLTSVAFLRQMIPTAIITPKNKTSIAALMIISTVEFIKESFPED